MFTRFADLLRVRRFRSRIAFRLGAAVAAATLTLLVAFLSSPLVPKKLDTINPLTIPTRRLAAAELAGTMMQALRDKRIEITGTIDPECDPMDSGLIGSSYTPITSIDGSLQSKQTAVNPNLAAVVIDLFEQAGIAPGDTIAVGWSGSLPGMNVCLAAAIETMDLEAICIASAASSQWGANVDEMLWIDMERMLYEKDLIHFRSVASSLGGKRDKALGMGQQGRTMLRNAIARNELMLLAAPTISESLDQRMQLYDEQASGSPIKAYINIGGGTLSVGTYVGKEMLQAGINWEVPSEFLEIDSVMSRFFVRGVPLIQLGNVPALANMYGLPSPPTAMPKPGEGDVYRRPLASRCFLIAGLAVLVSLLITSEPVMRRLRSLSDTSYHRWESYYDGMPAT